MLGRITRAALVLIALCLPALSCHAGDGGLLDVRKPMYGGSDRHANPQLKALAATLSAEAVRHYGSRSAASQALVSAGAEFFVADDIGNAMRSFNEAWLLDPENPHAYLGFAAIFIDQEHYCDAMNMIEIAETKGPFYPGFYPDAGIAFTGCAMDAKRIDPELAYWYLNRADVFFENAYNHPEVRRQATLFHWARAMYARGDYVAAWEKVAQYRREIGSEFNAQFLRVLRRKMPEPPQILHASNRTDGPVSVVTAGSN